MKAIILNGPGSVDQLELVDIAIPQIKAGEVLVKVKAISINPVDTKVREGKGIYAALKDALSDRELNQKHPHEIRTNINLTINTLAKQGFSG